MVLSNEVSVQVKDCPLHVLFCMFRWFPMGTVSPWKNGCVWHQSFNDFTLVIRLGHTQYLTTEGMGRVLFSLFLGIRSVEKIEKAGERRAGSLREKSRRWSRWSSSRWFDCPKLLLVHGATEVQKPLAKVHQPQPPATSFQAFVNSRRLSSEMILTRGLN